MGNRRTRIHILGNCQAGVLADCLTALLPDADVTYSPGMALGGLRDIAAAHDWMLVQRSRPFVERHLDAADHERLISWPRLTFTGYHPDAVVAQSGGGRLNGPLAYCHSALALFGWKEGLPAGKTADLFREETFEALGYFDTWERSRDALLREARSTDIALDDLLDAWARDGCFMHTFNHPRLRVMWDLARHMLARMGEQPRDGAQDHAVPDHLGAALSLPVYPPIAARLGIPGSYRFERRLRNRQEVFDLGEMIDRSYAVYDRVAPGDIGCERLDTAPWKALAARLRRRTARGSTRGPAAHPYAALPDERFWRHAMEAVAPAEIDPVPDAPFRIGVTTRIATAGSCFAQHIARSLRANGHHHFVTEAAPAGMPERVAQAAQYGSFSARYGNLYTARQLLQLFDRATGRFEPAEPGWQRDDGRIVDPFRPQVEPDGFEDEAAMRASRAGHLAAVRRMFEELDVFVFTLGLTEAWRSREDGAVFPLAPGVAGGAFDPARHEFVNFGVAETVADLRAFRARLAELNPRARMILTVSPVPLAATYEPRHVLVSTTASKAILRAAAEEVARTDPTIWYFPSYEIITGHFGRRSYFEPDLRSVTPEGVDHVMRLFFRHASDAGPAAATAERQVADRESAAFFEIVCDEEMLAS